MKLPIYMDNQATTPVDPNVLEKMVPYFCQAFGNAASKNHRFGWEAMKAVDQGREEVATLIGGLPGEIIFTSGATESDNLALKGAMDFYKDKGRHLITTTIEHKAVLDTCKMLEAEGVEVTYLPVGKNGIVQPKELHKALRNDTVLVSIMHANNEIGTINPIGELGAICRERGVLFHTDAAQSAGKIPIDVDAMGVDLLSLSAHKMYGPKGIGALYVRRKPRVRLAPMIHGGGHERGMRSGTLNVPGIVGFGAAASIAKEKMADEERRLRTLSQRFSKILFSQLDHISLNGDQHQRLPGNLNISFSYVEGESLMLALGDVAVSSGSACTSASLEPSYVLKAIGVSEDIAHSSIRFGLGRFNTEEEVDYVAQLLVNQVRRLREMSPLYEMALAGIDPSKVKWV